MKKKKEQPARQSTSQSVYRGTSHIRNFLLRASRRKFLMNFLLRVSRSCEHFPDGFDLHLLHLSVTT